MSHSSTLKVEEADSSKAWYLLTKLHRELITTNQNLKVHCHENHISHILTYMNKNVKFVFNINIF